MFQMPENKTKKSKEKNKSLSRKVKKWIFYFA